MSILPRALIFAVLSLAFVAPARAHPHVWVTIKTELIYAPDGTLTGIKHEAVLYDEDSLVEPIRIVQRYNRQGALNDNEPFVFMECVPHIFPIKGIATPVTPGTTFEYEYPDIYGQPWSQIWEKYHEAGMEPPVGEDIFKFD